MGLMRSLAPAPQAWSLALGAARQTLSVMVQEELAELTASGISV